MPPTPSKKVRLNLSYTALHCSIPHNDADLHQLMFTACKLENALLYWFHLTCEPLVLAPAFAIDKIPAIEQTCSKLSLSIETYTYLYQQHEISQQMHNFCTWASVLEFEVLVSKFLAID